MKKTFTLALTLLLCTFGVIRAQVPFTLEDGYYLLSSAEDLQTLSALSNDVGQRDNVRTANYKLTKDIDMSAVENFTPISFTSSNGAAFGGIFDGQGHTISNVTISTPESHGNHLGFIGLLFSGTLRNLCIKNITINSNSTTAVARGALVGRDGSSTIENCCVINFTLNDACLTSSSTTTAGAVVGYLSSSETTFFRNCYAYNAIRVTGEDSAPIRSYGGKGAKATVTNNYDNTTTEEADFASGKVCYLLNGSQSETPVWFQTLEEDASPLLDSTHKTVYVANDLTCDGKPKGDELIYGNSGPGQRDDHDFVNGVCNICGNADETWLTPVDGVYQLGTPEQVQWFAAYVNGNHGTANACLTADINFASVENFKPIGTKASPYHATFDGQGHKISNLYINVEGENVGIFGTVIGGATIKNFVLDNTCSIYGVSYVGIVGASNGEGNVILQCIGQEGVVVASDRNAGAIIGCNYGGTAKFTIENCYNTGTIQGARESAALSGYVGSGAIIRNCYNIGVVTGYDVESTYVYPYIYRGSATMTNTYSATGVEDENIAIDEEIGTGELTWLLNGKSFVNPVWFQTIGTDAYPVLNPASAIVYKNGENYANVGNDDSFPAFREFLITQETEANEEKVATQSLLDDYKAAVAGWSDIVTLDSLMAAYAETKAMRDDIAKSVREYQAYAQACQEARDQLSTIEQQNSYRDVAEDYLDESNEIEPGDFPNGNSAYVMAHHTLTGEELTAETEYMSKLLLRVLLSNPEAGTDMTFVMDNPDFTGGFNGWTVEGNAEMYKGGEASVMTCARGMNGVFSMTQTLEDLPNGIYELVMNGFTRTASDPSVRLYTADLLMNDVANNIMAIGEDPVYEEDAVDSVNCHITGSSVDAVFYDEINGGTGWVPGYLVGCSYAFRANRYLNRVAVEVTDGKLTLGVRDHASTLGNWTTFANARLYFLGTAEEANDSLTAVLGSFVARATTIRDFVADSGTDYPKRPNISSDLIDQISTAITESETASTGEQKMALIKRFSDLFAKVYACRMAYVDLLKSVETLEDLATKLYTNGLLSEDDYMAAFSATSKAWDGFEKGTMSEQEARDLIKELEDYYGSISLPKDDDGFYHLSTAHHMAMFSTIVNEGENNAKAVLDADIDMSVIDNFTPIGFTSANGKAFIGFFDGQGHTVSNVTINIDGENTNHVGFIGLLYTPGAVTNLCVKDITINNESTAQVARGAIVGRDGSGSITNCCAVNFTINEKPIVESATTGTGGIVGYLSSTASSILENCFAYHAIRNVEGTATPLNTFGGKGSKTVNVRNNYESRTTTDEQFASGEITYKLNGERSDSVLYYQTLGEDDYPMLSSNSKIVYKTAEGVYTNEGDGIVAVRKEENIEGVLFDLTGRRVQKAEKGLYIIEGRKVLVK